MSGNHSLIFVGVPRASIGRSAKPSMRVKLPPPTPSLIASANWTSSRLLKRAIGVSVFSCDLGHEVQLEWARLSESRGCGFESCRDRQFWRDNLSGGEPLAAPRRGNRALISPPPGFGIEAVPQPSKLMTSDRSRQPAPIEYGASL